MTRRLAPKMARIAAVLAALLMLLAPTSASHADDSGFIQKAEDAIDSTGALPIKFSDVKDMLAACQSDDPVACADAVSTSSEAQSLGAPSYLPKMFAIYFDIKQHDYWGLLEDAGETVACAAAQIITGTDICGLISDIYDAAKAIASDAVAVANFLADLGEDIAQGLKDIGCFLDLGGCSSSSPPPPPTPDQLAAGYYANLVAPGANNSLSTGLYNRELSPQNWTAYAASGTYSTVVTQGVGYKIPQAALMSHLPTFVSQIYSEWDSDMLKNYVAGANAFDKNFSSPNTVAQYVSQGMAAGAGTDFSNTTLDFNIGLSKYFQPGQNACAAAYAAKGQKVSDWMNAGRTPPGNQTIANPNTICPAFNNMLIAGLKAQLRGPLMATVVGPSNCNQTSNAPHAYACGNKYEAQHCNDVTKLLDGKAECVSTVNGPGPMAWSCPGPGNHGVTIVQGKAGIPPRPGCHPAKLGGQSPGSGAVGPGGVQ